MERYLIYNNILRYLYILKVKILKAKLSFVTLYLRWRTADSRVASTVNVADVSLSPEEGIVLHHALRRELLSL